MNDTRIEWTDLTWNPLTGCMNGCSYCYARRMAQRLKGRYGYPADNPFQPTFHPCRLTEPDDLNKPSKIFTVSMGDLYGPGVEPHWIQSVYQVMERNIRHKFLVLTKRPDRILPIKIPLNMWIGTSVESGDHIQRLIDLIRVADQIGARDRTFISVEPLLGGIDQDKFWPRPKWVIIGAMSGARKIIPEEIWALDWLWAMRGVPTFFKDSMRPYCQDPAEYPNSPLRFRQDYPKGLVHGKEGWCG